MVSDHVPVMPRVEWALLSTMATTSRMRKEATEIIFMEFAYGLKRVGGLESNWLHV